MSTTRRSVQKNTKYSIGELLHSAKSSIYYAFRDSEVLSAKVLNDISFREEVEISEKIGKCSTIVEIIDTIEISSSQHLYALIMPSYISFSKLFITIFSLSSNT